MTSKSPLNHVLSPILWQAGKVVMLDQRLLPTQEVWRTFDNEQDVAAAIRDMIVRGAPAIGCAAAMGVALGARRLPDDIEAFSLGFEEVCRLISAARPTAVNLFWAVERQRQLARRLLPQGVAAVKAALEVEAQEIWQEDIAYCQAIGRFGAELIPDGATVLTHCNAGALATGGYGTALGVIRGAIEAGKHVRVVADETRPFLQGARLTAWELMHDGIDVTLISDNMSGSLMRRKEITCVVVGSDRIARNGDVANKIGTYNVAVLAKHHHLPFYVAAPRSTIDLSMESGADIIIEERPAREVTHIGAEQVAPTGVKVRNASFDVTPQELVAAIVTEVGIARPPYAQTIPALFEQNFSRTNFPS